jgi:glycosyltransferase involved in cell wall biosynthesis
MSQTVNIVYDSRWKGTHGIGRFASELGDRLTGICDTDLSGSPTSPFDTFKLSWNLRGGNQAYFTPGFNAPVGAPCPFVITIHDLIHVNYPAEASPAKRLYYRHVVRPAARKAFKVLTVSEFSKAEIIDWAGIEPDKVEVVYNGVGEAFKPAGESRSSRQPYLFYVGNQKPHKNFRGLLSAFVQVRKQADVSLAVTGQPTAETAAKIAELGLNDHVQFLGKLSDQDLAAAYRGAAVTVLASEYEGFGLPVIESMACGTPVVCSNVTSLPEVAGDAAVLVSTNPEGISAGVLQVLDDEDLQKTLISRGIEQAAKFSWGATATKVQKVLNQLTATAPEVKHPLPGSLEATTE